MNLQIKMNAADRRWLGIAFNKNRKEYRDLRPVWKSKAVQKALMENFVQIFVTSGFGQWVISEGFRMYKISKGLPRISIFAKGVPNVMFGKMFLAMSRQKPQGGLRKYNERSMFWGIDIKHPSFAMRGSYPLARAKVNPFAFLTEKTVNIIRDEIGDYLYSQFLKFR